MSQYSSDQSSRSNQRSTVTCHCGQPVYQLTSFTDDNFGRRFLRCPNYQSTGQCAFFRWVDPPMCEHGRRVLVKLRQNLSGPSEERINRNGGNVNSWKFICLASWCALLGVVVGFWIEGKLKILV